MNTIFHSYHCLDRPCHVEHLSGRASNLDYGSIEADGHIAACRKGRGETLEGSLVGGVRHENAHLVAVDRAEKEADTRMDWGGCRGERERETAT